MQCSYSGEVLQQGGKVFELAGHKDVKVEGVGWLPAGWWVSGRGPNLHSCSKLQRSGLPTAASSSCYTVLLQMRIITSLLEIV